jgi:hypothetical protein
MLPASFQLPAAIVLVGAGLLACFAGYRLFRLVLGIFGAIGGALVATSILGPDNTLWLVGAILVGAVVGALILVFAYFAGVALLGAGFGAMTAHLLWVAFGGEPGLIAVILFSIAGALVALWLERYVIIVATALVGAQMAVVGAVALLTEETTTDAASRAVYRVYPLDPLPGSEWDLYAWIALALAGLLVQLSTGARIKGNARR